MDGVGSRVGFAGLRSGDIFGFQIRHRHLCIAVNISNYGSCRQFLSPSLSSARFRSVGKGAMKDDDVAKKDSVGSLLRKGKYKFWAVAAILLLAFWSMFTGTVTLKWSTGILVRSDGFDVPVHDDIDILEIEEREKVVRHMWDVYTHNKRIRLPRFWQEAFEAAYEELDSDTASVRDNAVSEIAKMSFRMLTLVPPQTLRAKANGGKSKKDKSKIKLDSASGSAKSRKL